MLAKILAALAMPVVVVVMVGAILRQTHHTTIPPLSISVTPAAHSSVANQSATPGQLHACQGIHATPFTGIAVQHTPADALAQYQKTFSAKPQIVELYNAFNKPFRTGEALQAVQDGLLPLIQLNPRGVKLRQIANGLWDRHLRNYAADIKALGCEVILSFGHEMNGWWYSWGLPRTTPAKFIAAWRHIHDVFTSVGATNVIWSWDPSHQYGHFAPGKTASAASKWYPGDAYVNWIGLDGYLGYNPSGQAQTFQQVFGFQLKDVRKVSRGKPVYIAETAVVRGPAVASQIAELFSGVKAYHLQGFVWFDAVARHDYRLGVYKDVDAAYLKSLTGFVAKWK
jgi:mannan endo-1,4-beta-mannosidase